MSDGTAWKKGVEAEREPNFLLAPFERRFLPWAARRLPRWILPLAKEEPSAPRR